jgi:succinate-acetate transporter protein
MEDQRMATEPADDETHSLKKFETIRMSQPIMDVKDKTANPAVLGLLGFGLTTFLLNLHNAGAYPMNSMV